MIIGGHCDILPGRVAYCGYLNTEDSVYMPVCEHVCVCVMFLVKWL